MNFDKRKLYIAAGLLPLAPLLVSIVPDLVTRRWVMAAVMAAIAFAVVRGIKKRSSPALEHREVTWLLPLFAVVVLVLFYLTAFRFGLVNNAVPKNALLLIALPYGVVIASSEIIRSVLLQQKNTTVTVLCYVTMVIVDVAMVTGGNFLTRYSSFMRFVGMATLPALTANLLYHFISEMFGAKPNILYRLPINLYSLVLPFGPNMPNSMLSFAKILLPLVALLFIRTLYVRRQFATSRARLSVRTVVTVLLVALMAMVMMLISCKFRYGLLVIATGSMTGAIDKGDAVIYEEFDPQEGPLEIGQVAVFEKNGITFVHRVVDVQYVNGHIRYYTKGDANPREDVGFITKENIVGVAELTIKYIGQPTLWLRSMLSG